jgi:[ribosomal protein S18]-alanine N-acetyltransferase
LNAAPINNLPQVYHLGKEKMSRPFSKERADDIGWCRFHFDVFSNQRQTRGTGMIGIYPFRLAHLGRIMEIECASFPDSAYSPAMFRGLHRNCPDLFLVARRSARIAGYMVSCTDSKRAEIVSVAVDPAERRAGVGAALMKRTLQKLKGSGTRIIELAVRPENTAALRFYRGFGFAVIRRVAGYYEDGGDALWMRKMVV